MNACHGVSVTCVVYEVGICMKYFGRGIVMKQILIYKEDNIISLGIILVRLDGDSTKSYQVCLFVLFIKTFMQYRGT